jgi:large subunit ribosomal protein L17
MLRSMAVSLFKNEKIITTVPKAKFAKKFIEHLITTGKKGTLVARRNVEKSLGRKRAVHLLFSEVAPLFINRKGGYTRIVRTGFRNGDGAQMCVLELVEKRQKTIIKQLGSEKESREKQPTQVKEEKKGIIGKTRELFRKKK